MLQLPDGILEILALNSPGPDANLNYVVVTAGTTTGNKAEVETGPRVIVVEKDCVVTGMYSRITAERCKILSNNSFL